MGAGGIKEAFKSLLSAIDQIRSVEVISVEFPTFTGKLITGETIPNIRLVSEESDNNIYVIPKVGSNVIVAFVDPMNAVMLLPGEVDEVYLRGNAHGGLVKVSELVDKLNNLENKVNSLINNYNSHTHVGVTVGAGATGTTASLVVGTLTPTQIAEIENDKVKHG